MGWTISSTAGFNAAASSRGPSTFLPKTQKSALYLYFLKSCQEDCGVDGSPGGFDGAPFGMEMLLLVGFGALQSSQALSLSSQRSARVKQANSLAQTVYGHVETTYWSLHGDIRVS